VRVMNLVLNLLILPLKFEMAKHIK